ncbi:MAG: bifunctional glutamate N-acetyltransferase/amino-acid acetyltransferase ArgJ [Pseudomonadota bacterium]|uniref:bifunctional glutamate N-acetyltransferase/amino-acid acetyltransferase ArgJ n=1 Tax=Alcanivorax sp. TaxID=1872427 RepID=UPI0025C6A2D2|nr:bifunctional glutamate N-acetyltransferase/amino-acid acetyltransferase ArgJ [Alcanivorax sp.]MEE3322217.1 bifunctional glutamate N-acetyltransferase/amino-acid acetyltransferase ArgJ [Pseudomonadota bacterium]
MTQTEWLPVPGIRLAAVEAGIKKANRKDLVILELADEARVSGVFTLNRFCAAPVQVAKARLAQTTPKYLMINTGYANAGTGKKGMENCLASCKLLAEETGCREEEILPYSTGVIGEQFPLEAFAKGIPAALGELDEHHWGRASEGIMTTDTYPKVASRRVEIDGVPVTITGMSKGSGMIKPNMATMLGYIATDAPIAKPLLDQWVKALADKSFNRVTVDGDTSTNDACMLISTAQAKMDEITALDDRSQVLFDALESVFVELAQALVRDGEGATKFVEITITGAASDNDARVVAETIAHSPLVKTALFASDPNWGRILGAIGRAPIAELDVDKVNVWLGDVLLVEQGGVAESYQEADGAAVMEKPEIVIRADLSAGTGECTVWTCDFSYDYVKINAEYRT